MGASKDAGGFAGNLRCLISDQYKELGLEENIFVLSDLLPA